MTRQVSADGFKKCHDVPFKPAKTVPDKPYKASYEHKTDRVDVKKVYRDADGAVIKGPDNFYTTPGKYDKDTKKRHPTFTPQPKHMPDDFDYAKKLARKEMEEGKKLEQEKPFSQVAKRQHLFQPNKEVYDVRTDIKQRPPKAEAPPPYMQEAAWKPAKPARSGASCTLGKYPEYKENPLKFTERKRPVDGEE